MFSCSSLFFDERKKSTKQAERETKRENEEIMFEEQKKDAVDKVKWVWWLLKEEIMFT